MPNIKQFSVLDIKYKVVSPYNRSIDDLKFQFDIPVKKLNYKIDIPDYFKFKGHIKGYYHVTPKIVFKNKSVSI